MTKWNPEWIVVHKQYLFTLFRKSCEHKCDKKVQFCKQKQIVLSGQCGSCKSDGQDDGTGHHYWCNYESIRTQDCIKYFSCRDDCSEFVDFINKEHQEKRMFFYGIKKNLLE